MISIIIPCYNQAEFLPDTMKCIQSQTCTDFECIIVDDGSTDNSAEIVRSYAVNDPRIRLLSKTNGGTATARNVGLKVASGDYVVFLDADDFLHPEALAKQLEHMTRQRLDVSLMEWSYFVEMENHEIVYMKHTSIKTRIFVSLHVSMLTRWGIDFSYPQHAIMYRMEFLRSHGLAFSEKIRYREDWDFLANVSGIRGVRVAELRDFEGAYYRQNPKGKTSSGSKMSRGNFIYLQYKCRVVGLTDFLLLSYRLSSELILLLGRMVKFRDLSMLSHLGILFGHWRSVLMLLIGICFLPLAVLHVAVRSILEYRS
ncbi:MAG: glycosyltransferase family 2 protein [Bacteroidales bacterium]|nr:glycosyltransferase family 2 protein [Bacteroidales bacterium]